MDFGIDHLTLGHLAPLEFIRAAREAGASSISLFLHPNPSVGADPAGSLIERPALREATIVALRDAGIKVAVAEECRIGEDFTLAQLLRRLETSVALGAQRLNLLVTDPEAVRADDNFATFARHVADAGVDIVVEFTPLTAIPDLETAHLWARRHGCRIMLDTLHYERTGGTPDALAAFLRASPGAIGHVQVCDGPAGRLSDMKSYAHEAVRDRAAPGAGAIPLAEILRLIPDDVPLSVEVPSSAVYRNELAPAAHLAAVTAGMRAVLKAARAG